MDAQEMINESFAGLMVGVSTEVADRVYKEFVRLFEDFRSAANQSFNVAIKEIQDKIEEPSVLSEETITELQGVVDGLVGFRTILLTFQDELDEFKNEWEEQARGEILLGIGRFIGDTLGIEREENEEEEGNGQEE